MYDPCSIESTPAIDAHRIPSAPCACAATLRPRPVRVSDNRFHFFQRVLRCLRIISMREHAAGRANLDHVRAVLDDLAHFVLDRFDAVSHSAIGGVVFIRQQVVVAMSAGDAQRRTADQHARSRARRRR